MGKIKALLNLQFKTVIKQWKLLLASFLVPILVVTGLSFIVVSLFEPETREPFKVAIADNEDSMETGYIIQHLTQAEHMKSMLSVIETTEENAFQLLEQDEIAAVMVIPDQFSKDIARGKNTPVKVVGNSQRPFQSQIVRHFMESSADFVSAAQSGVNTVDAFLREANASKDTIRQAFQTSVVDFSFHALGRNEVYEDIVIDELHTTDIKQYYLGSGLIGIVMIWAFFSLWLTRGSMENTVLRRLVVSGVSTRHRFTARLISTLMIVLFQIILLSPLIWQLDFINQPIPLILYLSLMGFMFITCFLLIETITMNEKPMLIVSTVILLIFLLLGGHILPTVYLPAWFETVSAFIPNYWAMDGYSLLVSEQDGLLKVFLYAGCFIIVFWLVAYLFEKMRVRRVIT
ncbi:ABC-2 type transport system permease protein [Bacillus oleivorans]|uniref:ABC-2 type transport system permease protein n=1 Tax=Bacillus oleivorans TaxID=1448271 RepID=A0A285CHB4_9BACI|nr:ABC transporter permease [Bacillus oleivorans]SNX66981.1 ABC-2 type transport system permease protein [Bacillus oleivorans]